MFVIRLADGEEVHGECDELTTVGVRPSLVSTAQ